MQNIMTGDLLHIQLKTIKMEPISFKEVNKVYTAGDNPNTDQLPVCVASNPDNGDVLSIISKWKLSTEELQRISETGHIYITILGTSLPPIGATVYNPFTEHTYKPIPL